MKRSITILHIKKKNLLWDQCDNLSKVSKQLYNVGLYILRQGLVKEDRWISSKELYDTMKLNENWILLPRKVSNQVWKQVFTNWSSWLKALKAFAKSPKGFLGRPKMPKYQSDRNIVAYEKGALGVRGLKKGFLRLSQTDIIFDSMGLDVVEVKILPKGDYYTISMIYNKKEVKNEKLKKEKIASFDLGLNNLVAIATNQVAVPHKLVNGRYLKSINQYWNKRKAKLQSLLPDKIYTSFQIRQITKKQNNRVDTFLHQASRAIVNWLLENEIGTIVIGKSGAWKNKINIGRKNNQKFVQISHAKLVAMIEYKFEDVGGRTILTEESYTSKASALDLDVIPKYGKVKTKPSFSGKRMKRGLYRTQQDHLINADINGSLNIMRKVFKKSLDDLITDKQFIHNCASPSFLGIAQ